MMPIKLQEKNGFALLFTLVIVSVVLAISLSLIQLTLKQLALSVDARDSELAFHAASAGLECALYTRNNQSDAFIDWASGPAPAFSCLGVNASPLTSARSSVTGGYVNNFTYDMNPTFSASGRGVCVEIDYVVIAAESGPVTHNVGGALGDIFCAEGGVCTVAFVRGYNKATCGGTPRPFEVMRELNAVF